MTANRRRLLRLGIVLLVLAGLALAAFTWAAFWPLEGSAGPLEALVPLDVEFLYKTSWPGIRDSAWLEKSVLAPPRPPLVREAMAQLEPLREEMERFDRQINEAIPLGLTTFAVEQDVLGGEIVFAGRWCRDSGPERGPPRFNQFLVLTRISWKTRFVAALKHGFVRENLGPEVRVDDMGQQIWRLTLRDVQVSSDIDRGQCTYAEIVPPENVVYMTRIKDVLALSNSESFVRAARDLEGRPGGGFADRPWVSLDVPSAGLGAAIDLEPLEYYLVRWLETAPPAFKIVNAFLTITALDSLHGSVALTSGDLVQARAQIRYKFDELAPGVQEVYGKPGTPLRTGVATMLPARDTFAVLLLRTPPLHLLRAIETHFVPAGFQAEMTELARGKGFQSLDELWEELAAYFDDTAAFAFARLSDVFDQIEYPEWWSSRPFEEPDPEPAITLVVRLRQGALPAEVDAFLAERVGVFGAKARFEEVPYRGFTYRRLHLELEAARLVLYQPAYLVAQDTFLFCSNETHFRKLLDTLADPEAHPSLAADPTFRATIEKLPERAQVAAFVDLEKALQVPATSAPGAGPRGFLWDQRNVWVRTQRDDAAHAHAVRADMMRRTGTVDEDEVDARVDAWRARYPEFIEEYRRELEGLRRVRALGASVGADRNVIRADAVLLTRPSEEAGGGRP